MKSFLKAVIVQVFALITSLFLLVFGIVFLVNALSSGARVEAIAPIEDKAVLHVLIDGEVVDRSPSLDWLFDENSNRVVLPRLLKAIRVAANDKKIVGIVVDYRMGQMGWGSANAIRRELENFKKADKFVLAYGDRWDELGIFLASPADKIIAQPHGDFELNGLSVDIPYLKSVLDKLGLKPQIFRVGKYKSAIEPLILDEMSEENRTQNLELISDIWGHVRSTLAKRFALEERVLDQSVNDLALSSIEAGRRTEILKDTLFSDEFDHTLREQAKWSDDDDLNMVSVDQVLTEDKRSKSKSDNRIAVVTVEGEIVKGESDRGVVGDDTLLETLRELREDEDVKAIVVRVNSPGGDALASDVIYRELAVADEEKPVIASMGDIAASGGYYIAAGARKIFAEPTTITGSIGVFGVLFNADTLIRGKIGVQFGRVATHASAGYGTPVRPLSENETRTIQTSVERTYARFLDVVQKSRKFATREDADAVAGGRVWSGVRAKEKKLVDELGGLDAAIRSAVETSDVGDNYRIEYYPKPSDKLSQWLLSMIDSESARASVSALLSPVRSVLSSPWLSALPLLSRGELKWFEALLSAKDQSVKVMAIEPVPARGIR